MLDLELKPRGVTAYVQLMLGKDRAGLEITHIAFQKPSCDPDENTAFLAQSLAEAQFLQTRAAA